MSKRSVTMLAGMTTAALALAGCGVSVAAGGQNAATHPASGIFESNTVGGGNISGHPSPTVPLTLPPSTPPSSLAAGLAQAEIDLRAAVTGGCWQDAHLGNVYGAYDQLFWWAGQCADTQVMITAELYPSAAKASAVAHHPVPTSTYTRYQAPTTLFARYQDGAMLINVWSNAPLRVNSQVAGLPGAKAVPGAVS